MSALGHRQSAGRQGPGQLEAGTLTPGSKSAFSSMFSIQAQRWLLLKAAQVPTVNAHRAGLPQEAEAGGRWFCSSPYTAGTSEDSKVSSRRVARMAVCHPESAGRKRTPEGSEFIITKSRDNVGTGSTAGRALDPSGRADRMLLEQRAGSRESRHFRELLFSH